MLPQPQALAKTLSPLFLEYRMLVCSIIYMSVQHTTEDGGKVGLGQEEKGGLVVPARDG